MSKPNWLKLYPGKLSSLSIAGMVLLTSAITVDAKEVTQQFNGLMLNANLELAEDGADIPDSIVLVVHGLMGHNRMEIIEAAQQALLDNSRSSLAINLSLGVDNRKGFFVCDTPHRHLQDNAVSEIAAWVAWLRAQNVKDIVLLSHSRGANESMIYAATQLDPEITHLVMLAPGVDDSKQSFENRYGKTFDQTLERMKKEQDAGRGDQLVENVDFWSCPQATVTPDSFISYYSESSRFRKFETYIPKIRIPLLVVNAGSDEIVPDIEAKLAQFVDGERLRLVTIEGSGHFFLDFNIEEAIEAIIEYLGEDV
jgi:pimeloyl-ACP methyl ester carboxylesterase